jgi:hypothetical protein
VYPTRTTLTFSSKPLSVLMAIFCFFFASHSFAFGNSSKLYSGDDETILIEQPAQHKFSYSTALKSFSKHILKFDLDSLLSGGKNCRDAVVRNFSDLAERTKYRVNVKHDRVELKFSLNF